MKDFGSSPSKTFLVPKEGLRYIYYYEWSRGTSSAEATREINRAFKQEVTSYPTVHRWYSKFRSGQFSFEDEPRTGRPRSIDDDLLLRNLEDNPNATTRQLANRLDCDHSTVADHLKALGYNIVNGAWVKKDSADCDDDNG